MRKRWLISLFIIIVACGALILAFPNALVVPMGFVKQEAFFDGKPTSYWVRALKKEGYLGHAPPSGDIGKTLREGGAQAVPVLCQIAENPEADLRMQALVTLDLIGGDVKSEAKAAVPVLTSTIQKEEDVTRLLVAGRALGKIDTPVAAELLSGVIREKSAPTRRSVSLDVLLELAPDCKGAIPVAREVFEHKEEDPRLRVRTMKLLWKLGEPLEPLVAGLVEIAKDEKSPAAGQALYVLGDMGPAAESAVPALLKMLESKTLALNGQYYGPPNRWNVVYNLGRIGPNAKAAVPALIAALKNNGYRPIYKHVAAALANIGAAAKPAIPTLLDALKKKKGDPDTLQVFRVSLLKLDPDLKRDPDVAAKAEVGWRPNMPGRGGPGGSQGEAP
jgi:HEAT repeat protein